MLCPDVSATSQGLSDFLNNILKIKSYAMRCASLRIGKPGAEDPEWLPQVRSRGEMLKSSMVDFMNNLPSIYASVLLPFINYQALFSSVAEQFSNIQGKDNWISILSSLQDSLSSASLTTSNASRQFGDQYESVSSIQPLLDDSIQQGWVDLASEEKEMVNISAMIGALDQSVQDISSHLIGQDISSGKSYVQSTVTMAYDILTEAGEMSIPFLSIATCLFTIGSSIYNVISTSENIQNDLDKIAGLQNKATAEAQAAAATKAVIQVLFSMTKSFVSLSGTSGTLPSLSQMWENERDKIQDAIDALNAGAEISTYFNIQTIPVANKVWVQLADLVNKLQQPPMLGQSVTINTATKGVIKNAS